MRLLKFERRGYATDRSSCEVDDDIGGDYENTRRRWQQAGSLFAGLLLVSAVSIFILYLGQQQKRRDLARELQPYVEKADGQPGLSLADCWDFARRANIPWDEIERNYAQAGSCDLVEYSSGRLAAALDAYRRGAK